MKSCGPSVLIYKLMPLILGDQAPLSYTCLGLGSNNLVTRPHTVTSLLTYKSPLTRLVSGDYFINLKLKVSFSSI